MYQIAVTQKPFDLAVEDLKAAIQTHNYSLLHIHQLSETLEKNGKTVSEKCVIFELCQSERVADALQTDMRLVMALPCRVSVYTERGETFIGMISPTDAVESLSVDAHIEELASESEQAILAIIDKALYQ